MTIVTPASRVASMAVIRFPEGYLSVWTLSYLATECNGTPVRVFLGGAGR
jgi:hypothetical protein